MSVRILYNDPPVQGTNLHSISLEVANDIVLDPITTAARSGLTATSGMMVYNGDISEFEGYNGSNWVGFNTDATAIDSLFISHPSASASLVSPGNILFGNVPVNRGGDFDSTTYTCPGTGYYNFAANIGCSGSSGATGIVFSIQKNAAIVFRNPIDETFTTLATGGNVAVFGTMQCNTGDAVTCYGDWQGGGQEVFISSNSLFQGNIVQAFQ
jgi:hypothetical protein